MSKVRVVIPTYNRSHLLKVAVSSVLNQTFQDFEIIIVDDASTDGTQEVVAAFKEKKIKYIRHPRNMGEAETRNTGLMNSKCDYIAFLDDDDEWLPEKLALQVRKLEGSPPSTGLIYTGYFCSYYLNSKLVREWPKLSSLRGNNYQALIKQNFIGSPSVVLLKRGCVEKIGLFDSAIAYGLDYDYWIRISKHFDFDCIEGALVKYRVHKYSLSSNIELRAEGARDLAKKYGNNIIANNYWRSIYLPLGIELCNKGEMRKGITAFLRSIRHYPMRKCGYFYFGIALLGPGNFKRAIKLKDRLRTQLKNKNEKTCKLRRN